VQRLALLVMVACQRGPTGAELDRLHDEVVAANAEALKTAGTALGPGFTLTVSGQIGKPAGTLAWAELDKMATTTVETINAQNPQRTTPTKFRGVLVRDVLDRFAASPAASEATMVSVDGFRATVQIADARANRMLLAIEADGKPIANADGGPIFLVHPWSESPEMRARYVDRFWAFYVTHVVVGTEAPRLAVGGKVLDAAALANIPYAMVDEPVGFKVEWPADRVHLRGHALVDVLAAAGVALPPHGQVIVHGKAAKYDDPKNPIAFDVDELARCKPLLAMEWGPDEAPIPARLGGPIALALSPCGDRHANDWVTFVERIEVVP
jgi:hypothetical protein